MFELLMVIIVFSSPVLVLATIKRYFTYKASKVAAQAKLQSTIHIAKVEALENQSKLLNERLAVLEKIVVSRDFQLSNEIAQL
jgi:hypothetical protein